MSFALAPSVLFGTPVSWLIASAAQVRLLAGPLIAK